MPAYHRLLLRNRRSFGVLFHAICTYCITRRGGIAPGGDRILSLEYGRWSRQQRERNPENRLQRSVLFATERHERIRSRGAAGWQISRGKPSGGQDEDYNAKGCRVARGNAKE